MPAIGPFKGSLPTSATDLPNSSAVPFWVIPINVGGGTAVFDMTDRPGRLVGIFYGSLGQIQQRPGTLDQFIQLRSAGVEIDPRQIRTLTGSDQVDVTDRAGRLLGIGYGSLGQIQQRAGGLELLSWAQLQTGGVAYDARDRLSSKPGRTAWKMHFSPISLTPVTIPPGLSAFVTGWQFSAYSTLVAAGKITFAGPDVANPLVWNIAPALPGTLGLFNQTSQVNDSSGHREALDVGTGGASQLTVVATAGIIWDLQIWGYFQ